MTGNLSDTLGYPSKYQIYRSCAYWTFEIDITTGLHLTKSLIRKLITNVHLFFLKTTN